MTCDFFCAADCTACPDGVCEACACCAPSATMTLNPSFIAATTPWLGMPAGLNESHITVTWEPPECEGMLVIVEVVGDQGYVPPDDGTVDRHEPSKWIYTAFLEPPTVLCPKAANVKIAAMQGGLELGRVSVRVLPVHTFFTTGGNTDFQMDYNYLDWKYAAVLATTGGAFNGAPTISTDPLVRCPWWNPFAPYVAACTYADDTVEFGTSAFTGTENAAGSMIGHELVHTVGLLNQDECTAYTWELDHQNETGISFCDTNYLDDVLLKKIEACGQ